MIHSAGFRCTPQVECECSVSWWRALDENQKSADAQQNDSCGCPRKSGRFRSQISAEPCENSASQAKLLFFKKRGVSRVARRTAGKVRCQKRISLHRALCKFLQLLIRRTTSPRGIWKGLAQVGACKLQKPFVVHSLFHGSCRRIT